ncbi:MAG: dicarboxylate/amino acid:cation symporter [Rickettsiales bacterium]|nr:MAG: dicarboxylate/amino acid:cation symporter [Rickettsiales bacterium]
MFYKIPILLIGIISIIVVFGDYIPVNIAEILFGISLTIKSIIIFFLPVIIFCLLFKASVNLAKDASKIIIIIFTGVIFSNFLTTSISHFVGSVIYGLDLSLIMPSENDSLKSNSLFIMPSLIANHYALFSGIILGIISAKININFAISASLIFEKIVNSLLKFITMLIPFFITGFIIKMQFDGTISQILKDYTLIFTIVAMTQLSYIFCLYFIFEKFNINNAIVSIKNMIPAALSGFSTMSSAATMPLTIIGASRNAQNKNLVQTVIPATVNIHLIGDCIAIPCFAFAILKNYNLATPDIYAYFIFTIYFVLAKFSVAAIPGGGIIVMLPILEQYLGFNTEMLSLITALYILFDPIITGFNVLGNGAFAKMIDKTLVTTKSAKI